MFKTLYYLPLVVLCGGLLLGAPTAHARGGQKHGINANSHEHGSRGEQLTPEQRAKAEEILIEARPRIQQIRQEMRNKMHELKTISYNNETKPEDLARLGRELQEQRNALMQELGALDTRLQNEVGVSARMRGYYGRGCAGLETAGPATPYTEIPRGDSHE